MQDGRLQIEMLHDRVMVGVVDGTGERRSGAGIVIPATADVARRLVWAEVLRERELHAVASERAEHGTGLYL